MITLIVLLWVVIKLQAPWWINAMVIFCMVFQTLEFVLKVIEKQMQKSLDKRFETRLADECKKEARKIERHLNEER